MSTAKKTQDFTDLSGARRSFGRFVREIAAGLQALHRVQYDEPWKTVRRPTYGEW